MLKGIIFLLEIIVFLIVVLIITLMFGINLNNLSYGNVHIAKLYIKYDKKLIVKLDKFTLDEKKYDLDLTLDTYKDNLLVGIKDLQMNDFNLSLQGNLVTPFDKLEEYKNGIFTDVVINDLEFVFDKKLAPIKADKLYLKKDNEDIFLSFRKPSLDGIKLDNSLVELKKIKDYYQLNLDLKTNHLIDEKLKKVIKHYGITVPIVQVSGNNTINFKMALPFKSDKKIDIFAKVDVTNGKMLFGDIKLNPKDLSVFVRNAKVDIKSNELDIIFAGDNYKGVNLQTSLENYKVYTTVDVYDKYNNSFTLYDTTEFPTLHSYGKAYINYYKNEQINIDAQKVDYAITYDPKIKINIYGSPYALVAKENIFFEKLNIDMADNFFDVTTNVIDKNQNHLTVYNKTDMDKKISYGNIYLNSFKYNETVNINSQKFNYSIEHEPLMVNIDSNFLAKVNGLDINFDEFYLLFKDERISLKSYIGKDEQKIKLNSITDLNKKHSSGEVIILNAKYKDLVKLENEQLNYKMDFNNSIKLEIPQIGLNYSLDNHKHDIVINKPATILNRVKYLKEHEKEGIKSKIKIYSNNNFDYANVIVDGLHLDINSTLFQSDSKKESKVSYPDLGVKVFNSDFKYDNLLVNVALGDVKTTDNKLFMDLKPKGEKTNIKLEMFDKNYAIKAKGISNNFVNSILKKRWFKKGSFDLDFKGNFQTINGRVDIRKTTVRKMHVLQNLITFVNTTPAIINPLLALPTLFRLGEHNFDMGGYYVKKGHVEFSHNIDRKYTNITSIQTKSDMMDFKGKGYVDQLNEKILFNMDVIFLKDYSNAIKDIPILGYIVTGDDGNFVTHVDIKGNFEEQDFESHAVKDAGTGVLNVIKRTLTVPFLPFISDEDKKEEKK